MRYAKKDMGTAPNGKKDVGFYEFLKHVCDPESERKSDRCRYCYNMMPVSEDPDDKDTIYCSKTCGLNHALARLNGEDFGGERVEPVEEEKEESPRPVTPAEIAAEESEVDEGNRDKSASSRLRLRLVELGDDDDLTIENLLATIEDEDEDSFDDSEPRSSGSQQVSSARYDSRIIDYERPSLDLFKHAIRRSLALSVGDRANRGSTIEADCAPSLTSSLEESEQETVEALTPSTGVAKDDVPFGEPENGRNAELNPSQSFGLASRLRKALNRFGTISKRNPEISKKMGIMKTSERPARPPFVDARGPSGDDWSDFINILQFMEKTGLGGAAEQPSW